VIAEHCAGKPCSGTHGMVPVIVGSRRVVNGWGGDNERRDNRLREIWKVHPLVWRDGSEIAGHTWSVLQKKHLARPSRSALRLDIPHSGIALGIIESVIRVDGLLESGWPTYTVTGPSCSLIPGFELRDKRAIFPDGPLETPPTKEQCYYIYLTSLNSESWRRRATETIWFAQFGSFT
jgi:hypothetical protein